MTQETKICSECRLEKPVEEFYKNKNRKSNVRPQCKICTKERAEKDYFQNGGRERLVAKRAEKYKYVFEYLTTHPCVDCGEPDLLVLEFDHVRGDKKHNVSKMFSTNSLERIKEEIDKCDVVCANCHRRRSHKTIWKQRLAFLEYSSNPLGGK